MTPPASPTTWPALEWLLICLATRHLQSGVLDARLYAAACEAMDGHPAGSLDRPDEYDVVAAAQRLGTVHACTKDPKIAALLRDAIQALRD